MADAQLKPFLFRVAVKLLGLFFAVPVFCTTLFKIIQKGTTAAFEKKERNAHPSILEDESYGKHEFLHLKSGLRLHCVSKGGREKPLMLFLHGFPEFWFSWRYQIPKFCEKYRTVALDMRGYCESDKPKELSEYHIEKLQEDVYQAIKELGHDKCVLVAHDWGGIVACSFAATHPDMVDRLILMNIPHPQAFAKCLKNSWKQFLSSWYIYMFQLPYLPEFLISLFDFKLFSHHFMKEAEGGKKGACNKDEYEAYVYSMSREGCLTAMINYYRASVSYAPYKPPKGWILNMKTLLIWGTQDTALTTQLAAMSSEYIKDLTIKYIPTAGHLVQMQEPDSVNEFMSEFLSA